MTSSTTSRSDSMLPAEEVDIRTGRRRFTSYLTLALICRNIDGVN